MADLAQNVLGGFLAAIAAGVTGAAWKRLTGPVYTSPRLDLVLKRFPHLPPPDAMHWASVEQAHDCEATGDTRARTRFLRREIRSYGTGRREQILLRHPGR